MIKRANTNTSNIERAKTDDQEEVHDSLIHQEYEQRTQPESPYYEDDISALVQTSVVQPNRHSFAQSFLRSLKANTGLIVVVASILNLLTIFTVYMDLNTSDACVEWEHHNHSIPRNVKILRVVGWSVKLIPLFTWFPGCVAMLWGFKEFKKNYLSRLLVCQLVVGSTTWFYRVIMFDAKCNFTECRLVDLLSALVVYLIAIFTFSMAANTGFAGYVKQSVTYWTNIFHAHLKHL